MSFIQSLIELVVTAAIFHFATFAIGMIPLIYFEKWKELQDQQHPNTYGYAGPISLSSKIAGFIFKYMSNFGMGMLIGTSFMLVVPEGVYSVLESKGNIGLDLLVGFIGVYLLDTLLVHKISHKPSTNYENIFDDEEEEGMEHASRSHEKVILTSSWDCINFYKTSPIILQNNVVFALVIHGISDGVSLGAAATTESLKFVMYIAIIIHKIPAALSLSSLMISKQKLSYYEVVANLWAFALSTPAGYMVVAAFCMLVKESTFMGPVAANLLLISGGSLLYAAFTAFSHTSEASELEESGTDIDEASHKNSVMAMVIGAVIPAVVSFLIKE